MNANIKKMQINILKFQNHLFLRYIICLTANLLKNFSRMSTLFRRKFFLKWSMTSKVIQGQIRPLLCQKHCKFVWMLISWIHNIFIKLYIYDLKYHFYVMERLCDIFTLGPSDLITTFVLVSNLFWKFQFKVTYKKYLL